MLFLPGKSRLRRASFAVSRCRQQQRRPESHPASTRPTCLGRMKTLSMYHSKFLKGRPNQTSKSTSQIIKFKRGSKVFRPSSRYVQDRRRSSLANLQKGTFFQPLESSLWSIDTTTSIVNLYLELCESHITWPVLIRDLRDPSNPESIDPHSLFFLGLLEDRRDKDKSLALVKKAAARGHMDAQYEIGVRYLENKKDNKAFKFFKKAAFQGHTDACFTVRLIFSNFLNLEISD